MKPPPLNRLDTNHTKGDRSVSEKSTLRLDTSIHLVNPQAPVVNSKMDRIGKNTSSISKQCKPSNDFITKNNSL